MELRTSKVWWPPKGIGEDNITPFEISDHTTIPEDKQGQLFLWMVGKGYFISEDPVVAYVKDYPHMIGSIQSYKDNIRTAVGEDEWKTRYEKLVQNDTRKHLFIMAKSLLKKKGKDPWGRPLKETPAPKRPTKEQLSDFLTLQQALESLSQETLDKFKELKTPETISKEIEKLIPKETSIIEGLKKLSLDILPSVIGLLSATMIQQIANGIIDIPGQINPVNLGQVRRAVVGGHQLGGAAVGGVQNVIRNLPRWQQVMNYIGEFLEKNSGKVAAGVGLTGMAITTARVIKRAFNNTETIKKKLRDFIIDVKPADDAVTIDVEPETEDDTDTEEEEEEEEEEEAPRIPAGGPPDDDDDDDDDEDDEEDPEDPEDPDDPDDPIDRMEGDINPNHHNPPFPYDTYDTWKALVKQKGGTHYEKGDKVPLMIGLAALMNREAYKDPSDRRQTIQGYDKWDQSEIERDSLMEGVDSGAISWKDISIYSYGRTLFVSLKGSGSPLNIGNDKDAWRDWMKTNFPGIMVNNYETRDEFINTRKYLENLFKIWGEQEDYNGNVSIYLTGHSKGASNVRYNMMHPSISKHVTRAIGFNTGFGWVGKDTYLQYQEDLDPEAFKEASDKFDLIFNPHDIVGYQGMMSHPVEGEDADIQDMYHKFFGNKHVIWKKGEKKELHEYWKSGHHNLVKTILLAKVIGEAHLMSQHLLPERYNNTKVFPPEMWEQEGGVGEAGDDKTEL